MNQLQNTISIDRLTNKFLFDRIGSSKLIPRIRKWFASLVFVAVFAGCLSQTVGEEGGWDPTGQVRVNGLYKWVWVDQATGDTDRTFCRFFRFRNDWTYEKSEVSYLRPFYFDTVPHADTTARFILYWQERGTFSVGTDSISYFGTEMRMIGMDDQFEPWGPTLCCGDQENIAKTYRVFTSDTWISYPQSDRQVVNPYYFVMKRIGDEDMEIPIGELRL